MKRGVILLVFSLVFIGIFSQFGSAHAENYCSSDSQIMFKVEGSHVQTPNNAHVELWNGPNYNYSICYDDYFNGIYSAGDERSVTGSNVVLESAAWTNAHVAAPYSGFYTNTGFDHINITYGDLACQIVPSGTTCEVGAGAGYTRIAFLAATQNSHIAFGTFGETNYNSKLCCASAANAPICVLDTTCDVAGGETPENCDDCGSAGGFCGDGAITGLEICELGADGIPGTADDDIGTFSCTDLDASFVNGNPVCNADCTLNYSACSGTPLVIASFDYQPTGAIVQTGWTEVGDDPPTGASPGWELGVNLVGGDLDPNGNLNLPDISPNTYNASKDYHNVTGSQFIYTLNSNSPVTYGLTINLGASGIAIGPLNITFERGTPNEINITGLSTPGAGGVSDYLVITQDVNISDGELNIDFDHGGATLILSGISMVGYCGNNILEGIEECDEGGSTTDQYGNNIDSGICIIDPSPGGLMCRTAICGDGYLYFGPDGIPGTSDPGEEECDDGNTIDNDDCSNSCAGTLSDSNIWCIDNPWQNYQEGGVFKTIYNCGDYSLLDNVVPSEACAADCKVVGSDWVANGLDGTGIESSSCVWDASTSTCNAVGVYVNGQTCIQTIISQTTCTEETASRTITYTNSCDSSCDDTECTKEVPCAPTVQLPFFDYWNGISALVIIGLIYMLYFETFSRNDKKKY